VLKTVYTFKKKSAHLTTEERCAPTN